MGRIEIIEEIKSDPKLASIFLLKTLFLLTIAMRELLAEDKVDREQIRIVNQVNHRILPLAQKLVISPQDVDESLSEIVTMLEKSGLMNMMLQSLSESRKFLLK